MPIALLLPLIMSAAGAAASGISGAAQNAANNEYQGQQGALNRAQQMALARQQTAEQAREYNQSMQQQMTGNLMNSYQNNATAVQQAQQRRQGASNDMLGTLSRAFLSGGH